MTFSVYCGILLDTPTPTYMRPINKQFIYTAYSKNYAWATAVRATSQKQARVLGYKQAKQVFGNHAPIHRDTVEEVK